MSRQECELVNCHQPAVTLARVIEGISAELFLCELHAPSDVQVTR